MDEIESDLRISSSSNQASTVSTAFAKLDANGDGKLTTSELTAAIDAIQQTQRALWNNVSTTAPSALSETA